MTMGEIKAGNAAKLEKRKRMRDWLGRYREALEEERQMRLIIRDIEEDATTLHSPRMDGMPGGTPGDAMANYVMRREAAIRDYERKARELEGIRKEIERAIAGLDARSRTIMRYRYFKGMEWEDIAEKMHYSVSRVKTIDAEAMDKLAQRGSQNKKARRIAGL